MTEIATIVMLGQPPPLPLLPSIQPAAARVLAFLESRRTAADFAWDRSRMGFHMILRFVRFVIGPALSWALLVSTGFLGVGGVSLQGTSDGEVRHLWQAGGIVAIAVFLVAVVVFANRSARITIRSSG